MSKVDMTGCKVIVDDVQAPHFDLEGEIRGNCFHLDGDTSYQIQFDENGDHHLYHESVLRLTQ
jgi:cytoskeletal protein CcmA (bactofilin family)